MLKQTRRFLIATAVLLPSVSAAVVDENRLWLPVGYERLYLALKQSAESAESLERCVTVLRGTLDLAASKPEHPVFRIQCRQVNGRTYNELVDGLSKKTLTTKVPDMSDEASIQAFVEIRKAEYWRRCKQEFDRQTQMFDSPRLLHEKPEPESADLNGAKYYIDFDVTNMEGELLKYRSICAVEYEGELKLYIRKRRE